MVDQTTHTPHDPLAKKIILFGREVPAAAVTGAVVIAVLALITITNLAVMALTPHTHGTIYPEPQPIAGFTLPYADGSGTFDSAAQEGRVTVYYFGFTACPDVCPETLFNLRRAYDHLPPHIQEQVDVVFITVDWENDTPEMITQYVNAFHEDFIGLGGTEATITPVMEDFSVQVFRSGEDPMAPGYSITHTTATFVVDQHGTLLMRLNHAGDPDPELMARDLRYVVNERISY